METFLTAGRMRAMLVFMCNTLFADDGIILVNRAGFQKITEILKRAFSQIDGKTSVSGILRRPGVKGYFVPENEPENGFWFTSVPSQINRHLGLGDTAIDQFYADALALLML